MKAIAAKMAQVGKACGFGVPKDGHNQAQNYSYTSAASVRMTVGPELATRGIAVSSALEVVHREAFTNAKGNRQHHVMILVTMRFIDSESGEMMTAQAFGEGMDSGDKASAKAMTMAEKYCYVSAFTLAMGEDPEHDEPPNKGKMSERLSNPGVAFGSEEQARADAQAAEKLSAKAEADGMINVFTAITAGEDASLWIEKNAAAWDALEKTQRTRVYRSCLAHVKKAMVDGMTEAGFSEEMEHTVKRERAKGEPHAR